MLRKLIFYHIVVLEIHLFT